MYEGVQVEKDTSLIRPRDQSYKVFTFDGDNSMSRIHFASFNYGPNKQYKEQVRNAKKGDRVCLTISGGLVIEFKIKSWS